MYGIWEKIILYNILEKFNYIYGLQLINPGSDMKKCNVDWTVLKSTGLGTLEISDS